MQGSSVCRMCGRLVEIGINRYYCYNLDMTDNKNKELLNFLSNNLEIFILFLLL